MLVYGHDVHATCQASAHCEGRLGGGLFPVLAGIVFPVLDLGEVFFAFFVEGWAGFVVVALLAPGEDFAEWRVVLVGGDEVVEAWAMTHFTANVSELRGLLEGAVAGFVAHADGVAGDALGVVVAVDFLEGFHGVGVAKGGPSIVDFFVAFLAGLGADEAVVVW